MTTVIFKKTKDGEIVAFFPYVETNYGMMMSYMHIGQHGDSCYEYYLSLKPANPFESSELYNELISLGYELKVRKRIDYNKFLKKTE